MFCNTYFDNPYDCINQEFVHPEYNENVLRSLMQKQAKLIEQKIIKQAFVVFDDCLDDEKEFSSSALKQLTTQCRHYNITVIFSTQYSASIPSRMRTNAMSVFIFYTDTKNNLLNLYESYGQKFETYNDFKDFVIKNTQNHQFLFFNKMGDKQVFRILKCPPKIPYFKINYLGQN